MQWVLLVVAIIVVFYFLILKPGRLDFWKIAKKRPDDVYDMFQKQDYWHIFLEKPQGGYKSELPPGEWDGPFWLVVPSLGGTRITIYGKSPEYEKAQQEFVDSTKVIS